MMKLGLMREENNELVHYAPPQAEVIQPAVEKFISTADRQFEATHEMLLNSAGVLEAKAAELRRRAERLTTDHHFLKETVNSVVQYEDDCRNVALSLSLIQVKEGE